MVNRLKCGHPSEWLLRLRDGGKLYKYCWGCVIEKTGAENLAVSQPPMNVVDVEIKENVKGKKK